MRYSDRRSDSYKSIEPAIKYFKKDKNKEIKKFSIKYYKELFNRNLVMETLKRIMIGTLLVLGAILTIVLISIIVYFFKTEPKIFIATLGIPIGLLILYGIGTVYLYG